MKPLLLEVEDEVMVDDEYVQVTEPFIFDQTARERLLAERERALGRVDQ